MSGSRYSSPLSDSDSDIDISRSPLPSLTTFLGRPPEFAVSSTPRPFHARQNHRSSSLPPVSSDGPVRSSPIVGSKEEKARIRQEKGRRKRQAHINSQRVQQALSAQEKRNLDLENVLSLLHAHDLSIYDLMEYVFNPVHGKGHVRWQGFFSNRGNATSILNWWISSHNRSVAARNEVREWAVNFVASTVEREARMVTRSKILHTMRQIIDYEFVSSFSFTKMYETLCDTAAPIMMRTLNAFSTSRQAAQHTLARKLRTQMVVTSSALACLGEYSHANNLTKRITGLYLYATGSQRQSITVLSTLGLSESYSNIVSRNIQKKRTNSSTNLEDENLSIHTPGRTGTLRQLSASMRDMARGIASTGIYGIVYDNINMMFRNAEQVVGRHDTQENGTCATLFPLYKANPEDLGTAEFQRSFLEAPPLSLSDILHTPAESKTFKQNLVFTILRLVVKFGGDGFKKFQKELDAQQPTSDHKIEVHRTPLHPLPAWNIDESTITGNAEVDEAIVEELHLKKKPRFWEWIRFLGGDQLSLARLRALEIIRAGQEGGYHGYFWGVWIPGLFHGKIADTHGGMVTHWGKPNAGTRNPGSLSFHNTRLDRLPITLTSLPPFRTCRDLIFVSLYARILHCLLLVSGYKTLDEYTSHVNSWDQLVSHAEMIYSQFTSSAKVEDLRWLRSQTPPDTPIKEGDMVFENAILFLRDALISREFTDAIKAGDSGRVFLVLKIWALSFRGSGRTKYAYEMLHLIHNFTHVWPEPIRDIVFNNWLLNPSGNPNSFVEMDLVQEHLNFWIKKFYKAHGSNASWDWLELVAPCVDILRRLAKNFNNVLGADQGTRHAPPDLTEDIRTLMESLDENKVYRVQEGRILDKDDPPIKDIISIGLQNLTDGAKNPLNDYNEAFRRLQLRRHMKPVVEDPDPQLPNPSTGLPEPPTMGPIISPQPPGISFNPPATTGASFEGIPIDETDSTTTELSQIMADIEAGVSEPTLTCLTAEDVEFDMDEVLVVDEDSNIDDDSASENDDGDVEDL